MDTVYDPRRKRPRKFIIGLLLEIEEVEPSVAGSFFDDPVAAMEAFDEEVFQAATVIFGRGVTIQDSTIECIT